MTMDAIENMKAADGSWDGATGGFGGFCGFGGNGGDGGEFPAPRQFSRAGWSGGRASMERAARRARRERRRCLMRNVKLVALLALTLGGFLSAALWVMGGIHSLVAPMEETPSSTPKSEWREGQMPYLYQTDVAWASQPYGEGTIGDSGCGPTALAMVYAALTGRDDKDPAAMAQLSEAGGFVDGTETRWALMTEGARQLGLTVRELPADLALVRGALQEGCPIICTMGPGDFTSTGHFIVIEGLRTGNQISVHDPNSESRSSQLWDLPAVLAQCRNLWAYSLRDS